MRLEFHGDIYVSFILLNDHYNWPVCFHYVQHNPKVSSKIYWPPALELSILCQRGIGNGFATSRVVSVSAFNN